MFKRYLQQPLLILWATIIVVRAALDQWLLHQPDAGPLFDLVNAMFASAVPVAELGIFYRAFRGYSSTEIPESAMRFGISAKILLTLLFLCLPYGLWINRRSVIEMADIGPGERWLLIAGLAAAGGFNLFLSGAAVHTMLTAHSRSKRDA